MVTLNTQDPLAAALVTACPYLGIEDDRGTRCAFPTGAHRCFRAGAPLPVSAEHQLQLCLTDDFERCRLFRNPAEARPPRAPRLTRPAFSGRIWMSAAAVLAAALVTGGVVLAMRGDDRPTAGRPATPAISATPLPPGVQTYQVRAGDTLRGVSEFFGAHPDDVIALNRLPASGVLVPGTTILIPAPAPVRE